VKLYSTNNPNHRVSYRQAVLQSLPQDNGLYMPEEIPRLSDKILQNLKTYSLQQIAYEIAHVFIGDEVPSQVLKKIVTQSINFQAPVVTVDTNLSILELFHGPTYAFKDFGARFMARLMDYFWSKEERKLTILVATSGDTGGAVASGFSGLDNIEVIILYPKGKVSNLQEKQLTTWGTNITALEVDGDFDHCQKMVKEAFLDKELNNQLNLSSANSINIARLIPQTFYYFEAARQFSPEKQLTFCVPSGNFGNLTAGLFAKRLGLTINHFIAATNINDIFPVYLTSGQFNPKQAKSTLSNAMDIGNPSNFSRILDLYGSTWNKIRADITGYSFTDDQTIEQIDIVHKNLGYVLDPHTAVGVLAAKQYLSLCKGDEHLVVLSTAHPIKFQSELKNHINFKIPYPASIHAFYNKKSLKTAITTDYSQFKKFLLSHSNSI